MKSGGMKMSQADIGRFIQDLQSNEQLRNEVKSGASGLASIVQIAKQHGYDVTVDEVKAYMRNQAPQDLSDEQLEALAGGAGDAAVATSLQQTQTQVVTGVVALINAVATSSANTSGPAVVVVTSGPAAVTVVA
jgi:predicted ribosomally synthesized peptide with nif11-like leader